MQNAKCEMRNAKCEMQKGIAASVAAARSILHFAF
jgi:hypothetical protein